MVLKQHRNRLLWLVSLLVLVSMVVRWPAQPVQAQEETDVYSLEKVLPDRMAYFDALKADGCQTPSLECLVHNVSQFTANEWIFQIMGPGHRQAIEASGQETSDNNRAVRRPLAQGGAINGLNQLMGSMYSHPPASGTRFVAEALNSLDLIKPAYAQGLGFASLDPILPLWRNFRNLAYLFFVVVFVAIGFLVMFRQKVGNAAVTAQQALPKVIIALLLVTFSYAIAGFMIDLMYLSMLLIVSLFQGSSVSGLGSTALGYNIFDLGRKFVNIGADLDRNSDIVSNLFGSLTGTEALNGIMGFIGGLTLSLVLAVAMLIATFKLFFELLRCYATLVLTVVIAPITLSLGAIPGRNVFVPWIKNVVGNLIVFPTVLMVVVMFDVFTGGGVRDTGGFNPPFLVNSGDAQSITALMGLAILLALPEIVKKAKEPFVTKGGFGEEVLRAGWGRAGRAADIGIPATMGSLYGGRAGIAGGIAAYRNPETRSLAGIREGILRGSIVRNDQGEEVGRRGGLFNPTSGVARGISVGQKVRGTIDDLRDGRVFQPDNIRKQLQQIYERNPRKPEPTK